MAEVSSQQWIERLRAQGLSAIEALYEQWRADFLAFANRYQMRDEDVLDVYQDALITLYENVRTGRLQELSSSPKTYLFSIGKYMLLNKLKQQGREVALKVEHVKEEASWEAVDNQLNPRQEQLLRALENLGGSCRKLIQLFYYQKLSIKEIVAQTGLKNENTVKAQKSRCVKTLRQNMRPNES